MTKPMQKETLTPDPRMANYGAAGLFDYCKGIVMYRHLKESQQLDTIIGLRPNGLTWTTSVIQPPANFFIRIILQALNRPPFLQGRERVYPIGNMRLFCAWTQR